MSLTLPNDNDWLLPGTKEDQVCMCVCENISVCVCVCVHIHMSVFVGVGVHSDTGSSEHPLPVLSDLQPFTDT